MVRLLAIGTLFSSLAACIVYDEELNFEEVDRTDERPDERPEEGERPDERTDIELSPDSAAPGETVIVFASGLDGGLDEVELAGVFGPGDVTVTAIRPTAPDELVLTLEIDEYSPPGVHDLLLEMSDGTVEYVPEAFTVQ